MSTKKQTFEATADSDFRDTIAELADTVAKEAGAVAGAMGAGEASIKVTIRLAGAHGSSATTSRTAELTVWRDEEQRAEYTEDQP